MLPVVNHLYKNEKITNKMAKKNILQAYLWNGVIRKETYIFNEFQKKETERCRKFITTSNMLVDSTRWVNDMENYQSRINSGNGGRSVRKENGGCKLKQERRYVCFPIQPYSMLSKDDFYKRYNWIHTIRKNVSTTTNGISENKKNSNEVLTETGKKKEENNGENVITNSKQKTRKQLHIDKQYKEKLIKTYILLSFILIPSGYILMTCIQNNITYKDLIQIGKKKAEIFENKCTEKMNEFIEKYFPISNEPLLPDFKDLNYPEHLPTLVIDLNYVIAKLEYDRKVGWRVLKRPYADLFFKELSSFYEIVIWSDDNFPVAQEVISKWGIPAIGCLHRDQCIKKKKSYVKDLKRLGRNLDRVIIIDHDPNSFMFQPANGILIKEFNGGVDDKELLCLIDFLKAFAISTTDVSSMLKKYGGGDYDIGRRYLQQKIDKEEKSRRIRNIGKIFHVDGKKPPNSVFNS